MAIKVFWNAELAKEYAELYAKAKVKPERLNLAQSVANKILKNKALYERIAAAANVKMPWWFVGVVHQMECSLSMDKHLHNGDPLTARTVRVPKNRPATGTPPFTFEYSAIDALKGKVGKETDWSLAHCLYLLEGYNGYGYRQYHPEVKSPYLWSFTDKYSKGKYVYDGRYDREAVSLQVGAVAVMKCLGVK